MRHASRDARSAGQRGYTLIELLSAVALLAISMVGVSKIYQSHTHVYVRQDSRAELEENLRLGLAMVTDTLRFGKYGVPANVDQWISWVPNFDSNPKVTDGGASPDSISVAIATAQPVATLTVAAAAAATSLSVSSTTGLDASNQSLILIGDSENAIIRSVSGGTLTVDTDPSTGICSNDATNDCNTNADCVSPGTCSAKNPGLAKGYPIGTPIYRVDVITFSIATGSSGVPELFRDDNHGGGAQVALEGISDLQITTVTAGKLYQVTLTARTSTTDAVTGLYVSRTLQSNVALVN